MGTELIAHFVSRWMAKKKIILRLEDVMPKEIR